MKNFSSLSTRPCARAFRIVSRIVNAESPCHVSEDKYWPPHTDSDISPNMNRIIYIIGVIVVIVIVLKLLHVF